MGVGRPSAFSHLLQPGLRKIFFNKYSQWEDEYTRYFNVLNSTKSYEEDGEVVGFGKLVEKPVGSPITYDDLAQSELKRYTHVAFGLGFRVTHELYMDDQYGIIKRAPASLARSAQQTTEVEAANVLNFAFNTGAKYLGLDGQPLCSTAHPNVAKKVGSGPYTNRLSTDADLDITSLQDMCELMEGTTDDRDLNLMIKPELLVLDYSNQWMATELLDSSAKPHTGDNEVNAIRKKGLSSVTGHYFSDSDAWFLLSSKDEHYLNFFWREKLSFDNDDDFSTMDALYRAYMRFSVGFSGWRGVCGTSGA